MNTMRAAKFFRSLTVPIIQAPMAGGINTPAFVAEVVKTGCVGSFGFAYSSPQSIASDLRAVATTAPGPIHANFFIFGEPPEWNASLHAQALKELQGIPFAADVTFPAEVTHVPSLAQSLEPIWQQPPALLTFHFGIPSPDIIHKAQSLGVLVGCTATSRDEAVAIEAAGCDFIVAQGIEAGGHRGTFHPDGVGDTRLSLLDLLAALQQGTPAVTLPIVGAGGIMTGTDIDRCLRRGCAAVQMGTAFLTTHESGASLSYKRVLLQQDVAARQRKVCFTKGFSGRSAQGLCNAFTEHMKTATEANAAADPTPQRVTLPFPYQNTLTTALRKKAVAMENVEYQSLWAGQRYAACRSVSVRELVASLVAELQKARTRNVDGDLRR
eukprot:gene11385-8102_t